MRLIAPPVGIITVSTVFLLMIHSALCFAEKSQDDVQDAQILFVRKLLFDSMSAKQIEGSSNPKAQEILQQARDQLQQAEQASKAGDSAKKDAALKQAKLLLFKAAKFSGDAVEEEKNQQDYSRRLQSVEALLDAHKNIVRTDANKQALADTEKHVAQSVKEAEKEFNNNNMEKALTVMENTYLALKLSISKHRNGEVVVRTLTFANKQEEYQYELDRNNTHKMLVTVLLQEKLSANKGLAKLVEMNMKIADDLRQKSEQQAESGDYEAAIKTIDDSTKQIIRAIRSAGIYIPG